MIFNRYKTKHMVTANDRNNNYRFARICSCSRLNFKPGVISRAMCYEWVTCFGNSFEKAGCWLWRKTKTFAVFISVQKVDQIGLFIIPIDTQVQSMEYFT